MAKARKSIMIIDGENLVFRYQDMLNDGLISLDGIKHSKDVYVWSPKLIPEEYFDDVLRVIYYTSATGDEKTIFSLKEEISSIEYKTTVDAMGGVSARGNVSYFCSIGYVVPKVFKKPSGTDKCKGVDISIAIDVLNYSSMDKVDCLTIVTGDGDFIPLIKESMHKGKIVNVMALSKGLNKDLKVTADSFNCIDDLFFKEKKKD